MQNALITHEAALVTALKKAQEHDVFCYFSTERFLLNSYAKKTVSALLSACDSDITDIQGPKINMEEIIAAAGVISFFGTKRIVNITDLELTAVTDKDAKELCEIIQDVENSFIIISCIIKDDKALTTKKAKMIIDAVQERGVAAHLKKPTPQDAQRFAIGQAEKLGAKMSQSCASIIVERLGLDYALIKSEVAKLAATAQYKEITREVIDKMCTKNIETNVFDMVRYLTMRRLPSAMGKLKELFDLQNDEIQITGAISGTFVDMYRVKLGTKAKRGYSAVFKDFDYKGSDYRLKKSSETAQNYTITQLESILLILCELDEKLKSTPTDKKVLLQTALCEISIVGAKK